MKIFNKLIRYIYLSLNFRVESDLMRTGEDLRLLIQEIMIKSLQRYQCVVVIADPSYTELFIKTWFARFDIEISFIMVRNFLYNPYNDIPLVVADTFQ